MAPPWQPISGSLFLNPQPLMQAVIDWHVPSLWQLISGSPFLNPKSQTLVTSSTWLACVLSLAAHF